MNDIYFDESGNTGKHLLDLEQHFFILASTNIEKSLCQELLSPLLSTMQQNSSELKYSKLKKNSKKIAQLYSILEDERLNKENTKAYVIDKKFYLLSLLIDRVIEPSLHSNGIDLYANGGHLALTNLWYWAMPNLLGKSQYNQLLSSFNDAILNKSKSHLEFKRFKTTVSNIYQNVPHEADYRDIVAGLYFGVLHDGNPLQNLLTQKVDNDPAIDGFTMLVQSWQEQLGNDRLKIHHDTSKPLHKSVSHFMQLSHAAVAPKKFEFGDSSFELPFKIANIEFLNSNSAIQIQFVDLISGAIADALKSQQNNNLALVQKFVVGAILPNIKAIEGDADWVGKTSPIEAVGKQVLELLGKNQ